MLCLIFEKTYAETSFDVRDELNHYNATIQKAPMRWYLKELTLVYSMKIWISKSNRYNSVGDRWH